MAKIDKKKAKIKERIEVLEQEMKKNLTQKTSNTAEISISEYMNKIAALQKQLAALK